jgi:hypothetical protein
MPPDFDCVIPGKLYREEKELVVQAAVEEEWVSLRDRDRVLNYIIEVADEAIGVAKTRFERAGIDYDLTNDRAFLDRFRGLVLGDKFQ